MPNDLVYTEIGSVVKSVLKDHLSITIHIETNQVFFTIDEMMYEACLAASNRVFDIFIDEENDVLFIGLFRLPMSVRGKGLSKQLLNRLKEFALKRGYTIFLEACNETDLLWKKYDFLYLFSHYDLKMMGFAEKNDIEALLKKWKCFTSTAFFKKNFQYYV